MGCLIVSVSGICNVVSVWGSGFDINVWFYKYVVIILKEFIFIFIEVGYIGFFRDYVNSIYKYK